MKAQGHVKTSVGRERQFVLVMSGMACQMDGALVHMQQKTVHLCCWYVLPSG